LRTEDVENEDLGAVAALVRGSGGRCNLVQEISFRIVKVSYFWYFNPLTPNDHYSGRTAPLASKVAFYIIIQQIQVLTILNMV